MKIRGHHIAIPAFIGVTVVPLALGAIYALLYSFGIVGALSSGFTTSHWKAVFADTEFLRSIGYSVYIASTSILLAAIIAMILVIGYTKHLKKGPLSYAIYFPLAIPSAVAAFFSFQLLSGAGLLSRLFYNIGITSSIESFPTLINDAYGLGIIVTHVMMAFPFFTLVFFNVYKSKKIYELARLAETLGASSAVIINKVKFPILLKGGIPTILLFFVFVLGSYEVPLLLGRQNPQMVTILTLRKLRRFDLAVIPQAYVIALLYLTLVITLLVLAYRKNLLKSYAA